MTIKIYTILLTLLLVTVPSQAEEKSRSVQEENMKAHREAQKSENQNFRKTLKDLPPKEKSAAVIDHRNTQFKENLAHHEKIHQERISKLREKLAADTKLTDAKKQDIINHAEKEFQERLSRIKQRHAENMDYLGKIGADPNLTPEQKRAKIEEYRKSQVSEQKGNREERQEKRKEWRQNQDKNK